MTNPRRVQCGSPDCKRLWENERHRKWQHDYKERTGAHYAYSMPSRPKRKSNTHCVDCGVPVAWGRTQETRCRRCGQKRCYERKAAEARAATAARRAAEHEAQLIVNTRWNRSVRKLAVAAEGAPANLRWPFASGQCHRCGEWFTCRVTNSLPQFCSRACSRQETKDRRRAREAGVDIEPGQRWRIYARDNYTCQLCGVKIERKATPESGLDFTIDHIIPLAAGGAHALENWQTAHRICNSRKRDLLPEEVAA